MLRTKTHQQTQMEFVSLDSLIPQDHLLRKISAYIDFSFIYEKVKDLYCLDNGRPCIDPVVLFKMLFIGYLFGIRSERQLVREIQVNLAYRWFLGLSLSDKVPDASTISQNRRRRFNESGIYQEIFDEIVWQAIKRGMVGGKELFTDSTHLKANANKNKFKLGKVRKSTLSYMAALEKAVEDDRKEHGKKPLKPDENEGPQEVESRVSTTDPESGFMVREGKPQGFYYLNHVTVDGKLNLVTDVFVTPGNVHDSVPYLDRLDRQTERFGFNVEAVALDAGYLTAPICHGLEERHIFGVIAHRRFHPKQGLFPKWKYVYEVETDTYRCPAGQRLTYRTTNREGYREYKSDPRICSACQFLAQCTQSKTCVKTVTRHVWEASKEQVRSNRLSDRGKALYARRKETIERYFADAKQLHGLRYCRMRGLAKVTEQCLLTAACQNIKKMAMYLWKLGMPPFLTRLLLRLVFNPKLCAISA